MLPFVNKVPVTQSASSHNCDVFVGQVCMLEGRSESLVNVREYEGHEEEKMLMKDFQSVLIQTTTHQTLRFENHSLG
jgi:hypothetical protein